MTITSRLLSLDGGGLRMAIPMTVLAKVERVTGLPCRKLFKFMAGTSAGALQAAGLAAGVPAERLLRVCLDRSKEVFAAGPLSTVRWIATGAKFNPANLHAVLASEFGAAKDWALNDSPIRLLLTATDVTGHPWYFTQDRPRNAGVTGKLNMIDCAVASACAPTYFKPWEIRLGGKKLVLFDGGVGVTGNPVHQLVREAFDYDDFDPATSRVISLGTGYYHPPEDEEQKAPGRGLLGAVEWTLDKLVDAPLDEQTQLVNRYYPGIQQRYDWVLPCAVDMADLTALPLLERIGMTAASLIDVDRMLS